MADLVYYGVKNVDEKKKLSKYSAGGKYLAHATREMSTVTHIHIDADIKSAIKGYIKHWTVNHGNITLSEECAERFSSSGGELKFNVYGPSTSISKPKMYSLGHTQDVGGTSATTL